MLNSRIDRFISAIKENWGPLSSEVVAGTDLLLAELAMVLITDESLDEIFRNPEASRELFRDPKHGFVLTAYSEREGRYRIPHDHGSGWVVYAVVKGEMKMETYSRAISQRGVLELVRRDSSLVLPGDSKVYLPGDIHDTLCVSSSALILRFTSCDLKKEELEGRMIRYEGKTPTLLGKV